MKEIEKLRLSTWAYLNKNNLNVNQLSKQAGLTPKTLYRFLEGHSLMAEAYIKLSKTINQINKMAREEMEKLNNQPLETDGRKDGHRSA